MNTSKPNSIRRGWCALATLIVLSVAACSSSEREDLILTQVDLTEVPAAKMLTMSVLAAGTQALLKQQSVAVPPSTNGIAQIALTQTSATIGSVYLHVVALDVGGAIVGDGVSAPVTITAGTNAGPVAIKVRATGGSPGDGGQGGSEGGVPDGGTGGLPQDTGRGLDGPDDAPPANLDGTTETQPDGGTLVQDAPLDIPTDDAVTYVDASLDGGGKEVGNILSTLNSCKKYVHYPKSPETCAAGSNQESVELNTVAFTPDGNYLVTAANNSWVKLWKVVDSGLEDTKIVFVGDGYWVTASVSPTGKTLAVGNPSGNVDLYDLATTIRTGAASELGTLDAGKLTYRVNGRQNRAYFTDDEKQVVVVYPAEDTLNDHKTMIAVWDLATRTVVREFDYDYPTVTYAVRRGPSTGPIWVVTGNVDTVTDDGGSHKQTTLTLVDASAAISTKPTFIVPGSVGPVIYSADGRTLALGTDGGEVSLWDLNSLNNIQRLGSPLVEDARTSDTVYALGYTVDGQFLVSGSSVFWGPKSLRIINLQTRAVSKLVADHAPGAFGFAPDGSATWAYGILGCGFVYYCKN